MTEDRKKLLQEIAREIGFDALFVSLPWLKSKIFNRPATAEDKAIIAEAREHAKRGDTKEAYRTLTRHFMGLGMYEEELFDQDTEACELARLAPANKMRELEAWLNADLRKRSRFRGAVSLEEDPRKRVRVIARYANLDDDAQRDARLTATGKLDDELLERIWKWLATNVPGISRDVWDAVCNGASLVGSGLGACVTGSGAAGGFIARGTRRTGRGLVIGGKAIGRTVKAADAAADQWGLNMQVKYPKPKGFRIR